MARSRAPLVRRVSASDHVRELLRQRIVSMELEPGQSLSRSDLASYYEVSQTPIRDAMLQLEAEGLLRIYPQARTIVSHIDVVHARETHFLRLALEVEIARVLCQAPGRAPIDELRQVISEMERAADRSDMGEFTTQDGYFHRAMFAALEKEDLWHLVVARSGHIDRLRKLNLPDPGKIDRILKSHREIVGGLETRDAVGVEQSIRIHLGETLSKVEQIVAANPKFFQ